MLRDLVDKMSNDTSWNLGRNAKTGFPSLKNVGDLSAHSRRYFARKQDIDQNRDALRVIADELLHLAKIRLLRERRGAAGGNRSNSFCIRSV